MPRPYYLPGSTGQPEDADIRITTGGTGINSPELDELVSWWKNRKEVNDSINLIETNFGGVDFRSIVQTSGTLPAEVTNWRPIAGYSQPSSYIIHAMGIPINPADVGEIYTLTGICHFYHDPTLGWMTRYTTTGRAPDNITDTEIRTGIGGTPPNEQANILIIGVPDQTINWTVEGYRLEPA